MVPVHHMHATACNACSLAQSSATRQPLLGEVASWILRKSHVMRPKNGASEGQLFGCKHPVFGAQSSKLWIMAQAIYAERMPGIYSEHLQS